MLYADPYGISRLNAMVCTLWEPANSFTLVVSPACSYSCLILALCALMRVEVGQIILTFCFQLSESCGFITTSLSNTQEQPITHSKWPSIIDSNFTLGVEKTKMTCTISLSVRQSDVCLSVSLIKGSRKMWSCVCGSAGLQYGRFGEGGSSTATTVNY